MRARVATLTPHTWTSALGRRRFAVVRVQVGTTGFDPALTDALFSARPEGVTFGIVDLSRRHPPDFWINAFRSQVGPLRRDGSAVPAGYYVFRDGLVIAHHPGGSRNSEIPNIIRYLSERLVDGPAGGGSGHSWVYEEQGSGSYDPRGGRRGPGPGPGGRRSSTAGSRQRTQRPPPPTPPPPPAPPPGEADPYGVLGVAHDCSDDELRAAYKAALKLNHPDRVAHLSPALQSFALAETQAIRAAWEALKERRGL